MTTAFSALLAEYGLRQAEFSRLAGIPLRTVQDWAAGKHNPTEWQLNLIRFFLSHHS